MFGRSGLRISKRKGVNLIVAIDNLLSTVDDLTPEEIECFLETENIIRKHFKLPPFQKNVPRRTTK